ncbi:hypothetical protein MXB_2881 [Myxobolus squamalis]|nr:hypothetical protein MXB_2881 [Myxobolus squamalis]
MLIVACLIIFTFKTSINFRVEQPCLSGEWEVYKLKHNLEFSVSEDGYRKEIFIENCKFIFKSNSKNQNLTLKMNKFGHLVRLKILMFRKKVNGQYF